MSRLAKYGVGGVFFLLPLFFLLPPIAQTIDAQLIASKFLLVFFLGSVLSCAFIAWYGQPYLALVHGLISMNVLYYTLSVNALYPFFYWSSALSIALIFLNLDRSFQEFCFRAVVYSAVASSVLGIFQSLDMDPLLSYASTISREDRMLPIGLLGQATKHGAFLAIAFGMALGLRQWVASLFILAALILTKSSFTWIAAFSAWLVVARYFVGRSVVYASLSAIIPGVVALFWFGSSYSMDHGRFAVWQAALDAWWHGPKLTGFGLGSFSASINRDQFFFAQFFQPIELRVYGDFLQAHNDYVQLIFEMGVMGMLIILGGIYSIGLYFWRVWWIGGKSSPIIRASQGGLAAILVNAIGNFPFQLAPHYLLAIIFVALLLDKSSEGYNKL